MLDDLQFVFWSIAYILIILSQLLDRKKKLLAIPLIAVVGNFSWELGAALTVGYWTHVVWAALDVGILVFALRGTPKWYSRIAAVVATACLTAVYLWLFTVENGMLYSVFAVDLLMAVCFLVYRKQLSAKLAIPIALAKLLGDLCAGIYYGESNALIAVIASAVLLCNIMDLFLCIERRNVNGAAV